MLKQNTFKVFVVFGVFSLFPIKLEGGGFGLGWFFDIVSIQNVLKNFPRGKN